MAMKVYLSGDNVIVEKTATATVTIPQNRAQYVFIGTNTNDPNVPPTFTNVEVSDFLLIEELRNDTIGNVQTQGGATVGSFDDVQRYLATFINRGSSVLLPADADVIVVGGATAANQELTNDYLVKKNIGKTFALDVTNWAGYPFGFDTPTSVTFTQSGISNITIQVNGSFFNQNDLANALNASQPYYVFTGIDADTMLINSGTLSVAALIQIEFFIGGNTCLYDAFADSPAVPLSNLDVINENIKQLNARVEALAKLTDTQPVYIDKIAPLNFDAFARLRTSNPETIFDSKQIVDGQPLTFDDALTSGAGATSTFNTNQASTTLAVANLTAGTRVRQTFRRFNYQPGKSFLFIRTAVFGASGTGITKRLGLFDEKNGLFFEQKSNGMSLSIRTFTSGAAVDNNVLQASWNIDKMDGTGASGITLDYTKTLIYFCDFEWLGVGTVRFGVFVNGLPYYVHAFNHSNINTVVYMSTPNLPLRTEISNNGAGGVASITDICSTVIVEGGRQTAGIKRGLNRATNTLQTNNNTSIYPLIGIRLKTTHLGALIDLINIVIKCTSTAEYAWYVILNPTIVGTAVVFSDVTNSSIQSAFPTNATTVTGGTIVDTGIGSDSSNTILGATSTLKSDVSLGSKIDGTRDEIYLCVQRLTGTTETFYSSLTYLDIL